MSHEQQGKRQSRRPSKEQDAPAQLANRRARRGSGEVADWSAADCGALRTAIATITKRGYAVLLGYTRDKGAYTVRIYGVDGMEPEYVRPTEDIDLYLAGLAFDFE